MKILLHICCGPCAIYCIKKIQAKRDVVEGFFYNPNIHPSAEYLKRKEAAQRVSDSLDFKIIFFKELQFEDFFKQVSPDDNNERCHRCWQLRINAAAEYALNNKFDGFTTTLLISPYQRHDEIKKIAVQAADRYKILFSYEDFRPGFHESHRLSSQMGLYHQNYCGCLYSEKERYKRINKKSLKKHECHI